MSAITLQINLCPGDIAYAELTVPRLVKMYRPFCTHILAIVDCCPPQTTQFVNAIKKFAPDEFAQRVSVLEKILIGWQQEGLFDQVVYLKPDSNIFAGLSKRYLRGIVQETHDAFGHALMSYMAALDIPKTKYILHFDADILMYTQPGSTWLEEACDRLEKDSTLVAVSPRISPPPTHPDLDPEIAPALPNHPESGWLSTWKTHSVEGGWLSDWISNRCFLVDKERLQKLQPLIADDEKLSVRFYAQLHQLARRLAKGSWLGNLGDLPQLQPGDSFSRRLRNIVKYRLLPIYPQPPEVMLHAKLRREGLHCLYLSRKDAWYVHPTTKPADFIQLLPQLIPAIDRGEAPKEQQRCSEIRLHFWKEYLQVKNLV
ncbi:hypothetical protein H6G80_02120 [Nostoc sp. FACHB-87]|uniref:hypothetical protein n=1 Tax=Nostocaceae TaxID=1162 RepID=UPI0016851EA6|nr:MULTISPECIES: hypothetical protein [Nostocaceae]MBD2452899.1 hypothetical protein [Nostoc sp. FACHB-87]MBD2473830.1 hypothetical protein [Anabaena sp. FACHB-83]